MGVTLSGQHPDLLEHQLSDGNKASEFEVGSRQGDEEAKFLLFVRGNLMLLNIAFSF